MSIPRVYVNEECPLEGYEALSVRVLANSTDADMALWNRGNLGVPGCAECAKAQRPPRGKRAAAKAAAAPAPEARCPRCTAAREAFGQALMRFFDGRVLDEPIATSASALALFDRDDIPAELVMWLFLLPQVVRTRRFEALEKNLYGSLTTPRT
jgi:hypothetical protein